MSRIGLVLGGGGITGAAYEIAVLMAIEMATGWDPNDADVIVGTSAGSFVAALVRGGQLSIDSLVGRSDNRSEVSEHIRSRVFQRTRPMGIARWVRHGILPGVRNPGLTLLLGSPAPFHAGGIAEWLEEQIGSDADGWPDRATVAVAYSLEQRSRVAFGTDDAPDVTLKEAVAASSALPLLFAPYEIDGVHYVDGGVASGTHADLVLGSEEPLDLVVVIAPLAATEERAGAWFHERIFDRVGRSALDEELDVIEEAWPETEVLVIRPLPAVLSAMRPNPMDPAAAVSSFIRALSSLKRDLAKSDVWAILDDHLTSAARPRPSR